MTEPDFCPTLKPTSKQFDRDFTNFVRAAFQKFPDAPCLKVCGLPFPLSSSPALYLACLAAT